ncbi:MAG: hypothetical protein NUV97_03780 [archaeon]|nr:hypothetical protein [archaeon]MCR4323862.1 hypothetical protein [Nanoarchaeota archaeon]
MMNKRGLEMAVKTVILMILGILILVGTIYMVTVQGNMFREKTAGTKSNVDVVVDSCNTLASTESYYAYCCEKRTVIFGSGVADAELNCEEVASADWTPGNTKILDCSSINCVE